MGVPDIDLGPLGAAILIVLCCLIGWGAIELMIQLLHLIKDALNWVLS